MRSMTDQTSGKHLELNDDGTARRKYELEEQADGKIVVRGVIGFVLASTFVMLKNVLFGGTPAQAAPAVAQGDKSGQVTDGDEPVGLEVETQQQGHVVTEDDDIPAALGSGIRIDLSGGGLSVEPELAPIRFGRGSGRISSSNDNEQLYGATPGRGIGLTTDGIDATRLQAGGSHGGGGGAGSDGSSGGHGGGDGDDGDGDDDGQEGPDGGSGGGSNNPEPPRQTNRLPFLLGPVVLVGLMANEARALSSADLLASASDADGDTLSIRNLRASSGTIEQRADGSWVFIPVADDTSSVTFTYQVSDGKGSVAQTATMDLLPRPDSEVQVGTQGSETIVGTPGADIIDALGGHDVIIGLDGDDIIYGGDGNDRIVAGDGDDVIFAGDGDDVAFGGEGDDTLWGGKGQDQLFGEKGNDTLIGEEDEDTLAGGDGNDIGIGGEGNDTVALDSGNDTIIATVGDGDDSYYGGDGNDTYNIAATSADANVDLGAGTATSAQTGNDTLEGIENVVSGTGDDRITGSDDANVVTGGAGDDTVDTGAGNDTVVARVDDGNDSYDGGDGADTYDASGTNADAVIDLSEGSASSSEIGDDTIASIENVVGSCGDDAIVGSNEDNVVEGGLGNDTVTLGGGNDTVVATSNSGNGGSDSGHSDGDDGDDRYDGGDGEDTYDISTTSADALIDLIAQSASSLEVGDDLISNFENVKGGRGNDVIVASDDRNVMVGGGGDDMFVFHSSASMGRGHGSRDKIMDFDVGDRIDIDRVREEFADDLSDSFKDQDIQRFVLIGQQDSFMRPGEMKIRYETLDDTTITVLEGNTDYDADSEFELEFAGVYQLTDDDFYRAV